MTDTKKPAVTETSFEGDLTIKHNADGTRTVTGGIAQFSPVAVDTSPLPDESDSEQIKRLHGFVGGYEHPPTGVRMPCVAATFPPKWNSTTDAEVFADIAELHKTLVPEMHTVWHHPNGHDYAVTDNAIKMDQGDNVYVACVVLVNMTDGTRWIRTLEDFNGTHASGVKRFQQTDPFDRHDGYQQVTKRPVVAQIVTKEALPAVRHIFHKRLPGTLHFTHVKGVYETDDKNGAPVGCGDVFESNIDKRLFVVVATYGTERVKLKLVFRDGEVSSGSLTLDVETLRSQYTPV